METGFYTALSGQVALQRRLETIADNIANAATPGFRAQNVTFESILSRSGIDYAGLQAETFSHRPGEVTETGGTLDVAVVGEGYLQIATPAGPAYSRDGRLRVSANGTLENLSGHAVLDAGGSLIEVDPQRGALEIARDGTIVQNGTRIGTIGLFLLPADAALSRGPGGGLLSSRGGESVVDFTRTSLRQGFVEKSNINPILEMSRLISVTRSFEALTASNDQSDKRLADAIRTLSGSRG